MRTLYHVIRVNSGDARVNRRDQFFPLSPKIVLNYRPNPMRKMFRVSGSKPQLSVIPGHTRQKESRDMVIYIDRKD